MEKLIYRFQLLENIFSQVVCKGNCIVFKKDDVMIFITQRKKKIFNCKAHSLAGNFLVYKSKNNLVQTFYVRAKLEAICLLACV